MEEEELKSEELKVQFEGQAHNVDANTVINTLTQYQTLLEFINKEVGQDSYKINLSVNAFEKGSFIMDLCLQGSYIANLISKANLSNIADIASIFAFLFGLYKECKGKPKNNTEDKTTTNNITIEKQTINIYNNPIVRECISKSIETAKQDKNVSGISIKRKEKDVFKEFVHISSDEFNDLIYTDFDSEIEQPEKKTIVDENARLNIITLSFEKNSKWKMLYNGNKISLPVKDENLQKKIDAGDSFAKGDALKVSLEISQRFNIEYNSYENISYHILEFKEHIHRPIQGKLFE
jgi:hypothetical protein